jgi:hypothetical protein
MRRNQSYNASLSEDIASAPKSATISFISGIVAGVCIVVYLGSMVLAGIQIYTGIIERRALAAKEFSALVDLPSAIWLTDPESFITNVIVKSAALQGVIISGANRNYGFERNQGTAIVWNGDTPRFKPRFGLSKKPLIKQVEMHDENQRVHWLTFSAVYNYISDDLLITILKRTLLVVLVTLCLALFALIFQFILANPSALGGAVKADYSSDNGEEDDSVTRITPPPPAPEPPPPPERAKDIVRNYIGQEPQTSERLASELKRCTSFGQDLVFMIIEMQESEQTEGKGYRLLEEEAIKFFLRRDLIFEQGGQKIAVILPSIDLDQGFAKSEKFQNRLQSKYAEAFEQTAEMYIGLSSRADRAIDAERLIFEASGALKKAWEDPSSPIVAFRSDPEKYKAFIDAQNKSRS